jgi:Fur family transcriptional regulator, zinc uptake regulator
MEPDVGASLGRALGEAERFCARRDARLTPQRGDVLGLILVADRSLSAYAILDRLRDLGHNPTQPMVYRALEFSVHHRLVHKLESIHAFASCSHPDVYHPKRQFLICTDCGEVRELERPDFVDCLRSAQKDEGFDTERTVVELLGTCARCSERKIPDRP